MTKDMNCNYGEFAIIKSQTANLTGGQTPCETEAEALKMCLEDKITDGKGLGFGLYTTSRLVDSIGKEFILHSGSHKLIIKDGVTTVIENGFWQGTLIYMVIGTGVEIDPNQVVDHTTFRGLNPLAERSVLVALQRRYKVITSHGDCPPVL